MSGQIRTDGVLAGYGWADLVRIRLALVSRSAYIWRCDNVLSSGDDRDLLPPGL